MPSTNKLSSRTTRSVAKFLLSFCGLASFGVVTKLVALGTAFLVLFAIPVSITLLNTNNTYATGSGNSNTITANLPGSVAIRLLDSTGTTEISQLDFNNLTPTPQGTTASKSFIVDVATSNPTGYKLYMQSDYQDSNNNYTTNLTHTDADVTDNIPTSATSGSKVYWNYVNPLTNSGSSNPTPSLIPAYGSPDKIAQYFSPTNSHQSTIDINVGIDTTIVSGTYENQLLFSAVGNPTNLDYSIAFNMDGGEPQIAKIEDTAVAGTYTTTLPSTIPTKAGYLFSHWQIVSTTSATASCSGNSSNNSNNNNSNNNDNSTQETSSTTICNPGDTITIHSGIDQEGDFVGDITLLAIYDNAYTYTITYDCNGGTGCPSNSSYGPTTDTSYSYTIPEATIEKTGYDFTGLLGSDSNTYNIGDTIIIESTAPDFTLTAQFKQSAFDGITTMQEMTKSICDNAELNESSTLEDTRDGKTYTVKKLKDGNCWMTQNLNYLPSAGTTLTSESTNVNSPVTINSITTDCSDANVSNFCIVSAGRDDLDYGTYYNWYAATASSGTSSIVSPDVAPYSICPKGWRLPTSGPSGEFQTLYDNYNSYDAMTNTTGPHKVLAGFRDSNDINYQGTNGYYWSKSAYVTTAAAYNLRLGSTDSTVNPVDGNSKRRGLTLRCIASESIHQLTVDPAGGTWSGSTDVQKFTGESGSSKTIANPTPPANIGSYNISYNDNGQGATYNPNPPAPTSVNRQFSGWSLTGVGSFAGGTFQYGNGDATLTAHYDAATFTLPTITKSGYNCNWAEGSTTGTKYTGGSSVTVTDDTEFYAVCEYVPTSCATATPVEPGSAPGTMNMYTHSSGTQYVKLYTASDKSSSACFTKSSVGTSTATTSYSGCSSKGGSGPPSQAQFSNLLSAYGSGGNLNKATGWSGNYWSSTNAIRNVKVWHLSVSSSSASVSYASYGYSYPILCVASS